MGDTLIRVLLLSPLWGGVLVAIFVAGSSALRSLGGEAIARLQSERRRYLAALKMYEDRANWIGSEFTGSDDPTAPARIALRGEDGERAIKALPPGRFAARKP